MKKTIKTMLAFVAGALILAGCEEEEIFEANGAKLVTLTAYQEGDDATKAAIDATDSKKINWTANDKINYFGGATGEAMTLKTGAGTTSGTFEGSVTTGASDCVLYPYQSTATCAEGVITAQVPMTQYAVANSFDPAAALMVGVVNGSTVEFKNVMSYVKVTIPSDMANCKQVSIKAKDAWTTVAGKVNITASTGAWAETTAKEGQAFVRLVPTAPATTLTAGASYYIAILPQTMATGFELIFNDNDVIKVKQSGTDVTFSRSKTKKLGAISNFTYTVGTVTVGGLTMADRNIGASSTLDTGDYFAWATLRPAYTDKTSQTWYYSKGKYNDAAMLYETNVVSGVGDLSKYTKYYGYDRLILETDDDIAALLWGGEWHIPTRSDWGDYYENAANNFSDLPRAGYYSSGVNPTINDSNYGCYWSSTISDLDKGTGAYSIKTQANNLSFERIDRRRHLCVRPVLRNNSTTANLLSGDFTVAWKKIVKFTKGNLYWDGSSYAFETNQYDFPTTWDESHVGHLYWISSDAVASYEPYERVYNVQSVNDNDKLWCSEDYKQTISTTSGLYAMSYDEWKYLLNTSDSGTGRHQVNRFAKAKVNGNKGLLIFPDGYNGATPVSGTGIATINSTSADFPSESIPNNDWAAMENKGVVFLPVAGTRGVETGTISGCSFDFDGGSYWTSSRNGNYAYAFVFGDTYCNFNTHTRHSLDRERTKGESLRLVKTVLNLAL